jgi:Fur family ferric uptake transcriptional regulator
MPPIGHPDRSPPLVELTNRLRRHARKVTSPRQAILGLLREQTRPRSSRELFETLPVGECDLATVYRSLHVLERLGLVKRFTLGDRVARFQLVPDGEPGHQHHLICTLCACTVSIPDCFPPEFEHRIAQANGFRSMTHRLEFFGVCPDCQGASDSGPSPTEPGERHLPDQIEMDKP